MNIDQFFEEIQDKKIEMQKALKRYVEATEDFYTITGVKYTEMPKSQGKALGFDDLLANIETLYNEYLELREKHKILYGFYITYINRIKDKTYRLIIEYSFVNGENDKELTESLHEYHRLDYTNAHVRRLKSKAIKEFEKLIDATAIRELKEITNKIDTK